MSKKDREETEPEALVHPGKGGDPKDYPKSSSLGLNDGHEPGEDEETEPEMLVHPPEYDLDEVKRKAGQEDDDD